MKYITIFFKLKKFDSNKSMYKINNLMSSTPTCLCHCRSHARVAVNILNKYNIKPKRNPGIISLPMMKMYGATTNNLLELYEFYTNIGKDILNKRHIDTPYCILGNFTDMLELLFATRKNMIKAAIENKIQENCLNAKTILEELGGAEYIIRTFKENGFCPRYKPGIIYSIYAWAKKCSCCSRHSKNFPLWEPWNETTRCIFVKN